MILLAGHGHAPHTQTAQLLMAQLCSGMTSVTGIAGSVGAGKQGEFSKTYCAIIKLVGLNFLPV